MKEKGEKKNIPTHPLLQPPPPTSPKKKFFEKKKKPNLPTLRKDQTFSSHATKKKPLENNSHPPKKITPSNPT